MARGVTERIACKRLAEATEYEFKSSVEINKPRSWLKTVSAFANGVGGSLYFGVSDEGVPVGLPNARQTVDQVSELIKVRIDPAVHVVVELLNANGRDILRVHVASGADTPYYYTVDGNKIAYYRVGNESASAPASILNELILKGRCEGIDRNDL